MAQQWGVHLRSAVMAAGLGGRMISSSRLREKGTKENTFLKSVLVVGGWGGGDTCDPSTWAAEVRA